MYFDSSLYENKMHYKISQYLDEIGLPDEEWSELTINADTEEGYNDALDKMYHYMDGKIRMFGEPKDPMEVVIERDPRLNYRKFDEDAFLMNTNNDTTEV